MNTITIILVILLFIACGVIIFICSEMTLMKDLKNIYKNRVEEQDETIKKLFNHFDELHSLADSYRNVNCDLLEALEYADHFLKPRKRTCMWKLAAKHVKKQI